MIIRVSKFGGDGKLRKEVKNNFVVWVKKEGHRDHKQHGTLSLSLSLSMI